MSLRILVISHGHPALDPGGAEIAAYGLFRGLQGHANVRAWFLAARPPDRPDDAMFSRFRGRPEEILLASRGFNRFWLSQTTPEIMDGLTTLLRRLDPDVIHLHHVLHIGLEIIAIARQVRPSVRIVFTLHEYLAICHHYGTMVRVADGGLCNAAGPAACGDCFPAIAPEAFDQRRQQIHARLGQVDQFIAPSAFLLRRYVAWGLPADRIVHLPNGTEPVVHPPTPRPRPTGERRSVLGFFGQMHRFKGLLELLQALDLLFQPGKTPDCGIYLSIHGAYLGLDDPDYAAAVTALLRRHAGRVTFHGPYTGHDRYRLLTAVDWVVVPSIWWENAPLVIEEALAHRRPVICGDIGGMAEKVRPGLDGYHFPVGDIGALAALLDRVDRDPTMRHRLAATLRRPLTVAETVLRHLDIYRDAAGLRPGTPPNEAANRAAGPLQGTNQ